MIVATFLGVSSEVKVSGWILARPFLAPFEVAFTAQAGLGWEAVLGFCLHGFDISGLVRFYEFPKPRLQGSHFELTSIEKFH